MPYIRHISARRHKLVVHFLDGRVLKGSTYKLDPDRKGFYLIPINPDPENPEVWVEFQKVKAIFYVKDFDGKPVEEDFHREYVPEGCEITVKFKDGEIVKGFALQYDESKPTFFVDIPDPSSNNYCMLVNRAAGACYHNRPHPQFCQARYRVLRAGRTCRIYRLFKKCCAFSPRDRR